MAETTKLTTENQDKKITAQTARPELKSGMTVKVHQKIKETDTKGKTKERIQVFEGIILGVKKAKTISGTFTVRKISDGIGVEKIFPIYSPLVEKIEVVKQAKVRRAKLFYLRDYKKRLKDKKTGKRK
jgi:large subunit ribosomal protein L19